MRIIKFRAWNGKKMLHNVGFHPFIIQALWRDPDNQMKEGDEGAYLISPQFTQYHLMQFTGLHDKNGKEIFEGDILKVHRFIQVLGENLGVSEGEEENIMTVEYLADNICFLFKKVIDEFTDLLLEPYECSDEGIEVIGNVFQNPELLGE